MPFPSDEYLVKTEEEPQVEDDLAFEDNEGDMMD